MGLVESVTDSGLVLLEGRQDGAAVARALQQEDPRLHLRVDQNGLWRVYYSDQGRDVFILAWQDANGKPLPLSMRLLDEVKARDKATGDPLDADALNERMQQELRRQQQRDLEAIESEYLPILETRRLSVQIPRDL